MDCYWMDEESGILIQEQMAGVDIRGASIRSFTGFYYGTYISIGRPMFRWIYNELDDTVQMSSSQFDMYASFGIPFGYRWQFPGRSTAFYLGAGPSFLGLFDFGSHMWGSGGIFCEFGLETLKTEGIAVSIGGRVVIPLGSFITDGTYISEAMDGTSSAFTIGMSWTGNRRD